MNSVDEIITAYGGVSLDKLILASIVLVIVTAVFVWLIANYGISIKSFSIGGSKKILDSSRNDILLKDTLDNESSEMDYTFKQEIKSLIGKKRFELLKILNLKCPFIAYTVGFFFYSTLLDYATNTSFISHLSRDNRSTFISLLAHNMLEHHSSLEAFIVRCSCEAEFPSMDKFKTTVVCVLSEVFDEFVLEAHSYLEKKIKMYQEAKKAFKDSFFQKSICDKQIKKLNAVLFSME